MRVVNFIRRSLRLRCPRCGQGKLFAGWFRMHSHCSYCNLAFDREPGYFLGSIYFNYGLTALIVTAAYMAGFFLGVQQETLLYGLMAFCLLFPLWFFRYARSLWMGFDELMDAREPKKDSDASRIIDEAIRKRDHAASGPPARKSEEP
ncbi:MAG TPA: DUF983 domain-containing protein [Pirellulales bacterium]|jgi:uncharacterized protein (DUF983 family)|nr:DUF983 domain-containing protein [Pirellulales bacterium]